MNERRCGCGQLAGHPDARGCYDLRYYGRTPVLRGNEALGAEGEMAYCVVDPFDDDECPCICHEEDDR